MSKLHQVLPYKMAEFNRYLLPYSIRYMSCSMVGSFFFFVKWLMGWGHQHSHTSWEQSVYSHERFKPISTFFGKGKKSILTLEQKFVEMCSITHHDKSYQTKLANHSTQGIWVGFTGGHPVGIYCEFNSKRREISLT